MGISKELLAYGDEFTALCAGVNITPIVYGSLACFSYLGDSDLPVNDIDFLVREAEFSRIIAAAGEMAGVRYEPTTYHSIKFFRGGLKVSFDAAEHYLAGLKPRPLGVSIEGFEFRIVDLTTLREVYRRGITAIPSKSKAYSDKLRYLNGIAR